VVEPGAIEAAILAWREAAGKQNDVARALELDLQAAQYAAEKAWKQYDATDPENRLVASELERRWNATLEKVREIEERIEEEKARGDAMVPPTAEGFNGLARDLERVWDDAATDARLKKRILRTLIEEIVADVDAKAGEVELLIHWKGGVHTELRIHRRRRGESRHAAPKEAVEAVRALALICPDVAIAGYLNRNGLRTGKGNRWTRERVTSLRSKRKIPCYSPERKRGEGWTTLTEAATRLGLSTGTLRRAVERGKLAGMHPLPDGPWIFKRTDLQSPAVRELVERVRQRRNTGAAQHPGQLSLLKSSTYRKGAV
jgi:hypothetical protein